jgi:hypothetical protein
MPLIGEFLMLRIETEREEDGRRIAEVPALPGVMTRIARRTGLRPEDL